MNETSEESRLDEIKDIEDKLEEIKKHETRVQVDSSPYAMYLVMQEPDLQNIIPVLLNAISLDLNISEEWYKHWDKTVALHGLVSDLPNTIKWSYNSANTIAAAVSGSEDQSKMRSYAPLQTAIVRANDLIKHIDPSNNSPYKMSIVDDYEENDLGLSVVDLTHLLAALISRKGYRADVIEDLREKGICIKTIHVKDSIKEYHQHLENSTYRMRWGNTPIGIARVENESN